MKRHLTLMVLVALPLMSMADPLVGFATISMKGMSPYQPGSCATLSTEAERDGCVDFTYVRIYKIRNFVDVKGRKVRVGTMVMTGHNRQEGPWFLVLEELPIKDQKAYGARYRFVDGSTILPTACIRRDANEYVTLGNNDKYYSFATGDNGHCYYLHQLQKWMNVR
jgi:hypothetical protein